MAEELELSLGLSLNGRFGTDPNSTKNEDNYLMRSASSVSNLLEVSSMMKQQQTLTRTCSLPLEVEEETRKRKEIQMLRRMEAKRKRSEKQRRENGIVAGGGGSGAFEMGHGKMDFLVNGDPRQGFSGRGFESKPGFRSGLGGGDNVGGGLPPAPLSQGSSASSSGTSEFDSQTPPPPPSGTNKSAEAKSPQSVQSFSDQNEQRPVLWSAEPKRLRKTASEDVTHLTPSRSISEASSIIKNVLADMPSVSTKGSGPNGKRVEGFLYRYRKGEEVRIVCVCHGNFLTPGEFIKHAGGGDVENPLRHIVVNPAPF